MFLSGIIKKNLGFAGPFLFGMGGAVLSMAYTYFFIKDSRTMRPREVEEELTKRKVGLPNRTVALIYFLLLLRDNWIL